MAHAHAKGDSGAWRPADGGGRFRIFETMADVGAEAEGPTIEAAEAAAVAGMYFIITPEARVERRVRREVVGEAKDPPVAFARALQQLLVLFDSEGFVAAGAAVRDEAGPTRRCTITLEGEPFDAARHPPGVEIKAVTHHELLVDPANKHVRVIFDI